MKKSLEYLLLLAPAILWGLGALLLGDHFTLPNRLILSVLCTASGAGALLMQRKGQGLLALVAGLGMLASVPITHDMPVASFTLRMQDYDLPQQVSARNPEAMAMLQGNSADLVSLKGEPVQAAEIAAAQTAYPFTYTSCAAGGRSFLSRHPITQVREELRMGATQLRGELQHGDTAVRFVVLDFSGLESEAQARSLAQEYLAGERGASIALIDTGRSGNRVPMEWISYTTGYARSQQPMAGFMGSFDGGGDDPTQLLLYSPRLRCRAFDQSGLGMEATYTLN